MTQGLDRIREDIQHWKVKLAAAKHELYLVATAAYSDRKPEALRQAGLFESDIRVADFRLAQLADKEKRVEGKV